MGFDARRENEHSCFCLMWNGRYFLCAISKVIRNPEPRRFSLNVPSSDSDYLFPHNSGSTLTRFSSFLAGLFINTNNNGLALKHASTRQTGPTDARGPPLHDGIRS